MKTCPHCAETDLQDNAKICKHCGKTLAGSGCLTNIFYLGVVICVIGGFFFWPIWILAAVLLMAIVVDKE